MAVTLSPSCSNAAFLFSPRPGGLGVKTPRPSHAEGFLHREEEEVALSVSDDELSSIVSEEEHVEQSQFWAYSIPELKAKILQHKKWEAIDPYSENDGFSVPAWITEEREEMEAILRVKMDEDETSWPIAPSYSMVKKMVEDKKALVEMGELIERQVDSFFFRHNPLLLLNYIQSMGMMSSKKILEMKKKELKAMPIFNCKKCQKGGKWCSAQCDYQAIVWVVKEESGKKD